MKTAQPLQTMSVRRRLATLPLLTAGLLALSPAALPAAAAAAPPGERCDRESAKAAFASGMERYGRRLWKEAVPQIEEAAALCPIPKSTFVVTVNLFGQYQYLPFYFLGKCRYNLRDLPEALRQFYLSSCFGEPARDEEGTSKDRGALIDDCRQRTAKKQRPQQHPYFADGVAAAEQQKWDGAAEKMWDSLLVWDEDGGPIPSHTRWADPYLPRFRLAEALFQLGCYREACEQLDRSQLRSLGTQEVERERRRMEQLRPECERRKRDEEKEICQRWQCWLNQRGL